MLSFPYKSTIIHQKSNKIFVTGFWFFIVCCKSFFYFVHNNSKKKFSISKINYIWSIMICHFTYGLKNYLSLVKFLLSVILELWASCSLNKVIDGVNIVDRAFSTRERHIVGATPTATLLYFCSYICIEVIRLAVVQIRGYFFSDFVVILYLHGSLIGYFSPRQKALC